MPAGVSKPCIRSAQWSKASKFMERALVRNVGGSKKLPAV